MPEGAEAGKWGQSLSGHGSLSFTVTDRLVRFAHAHSTFCSELQALRFCIHAQDPDRMQRCSVLS